MTTPIQIKTFYFWWKQGVLELLRYPSDSVLALIFRFLVPMLVKIGLLSLYNLNSANSLGSTRKIIVYYLVSQIFWSFFASNGTVANFINQANLTGELSFSIIKPGNIFSSYLAKFFAQNLDAQIFALVSFCLGMYLNQSGGISREHIPLLVWAFINLGLISISINLVISGICIRTGNGKNIHNTLLHIIELTRGSFFPLYLFPQVWQNVLLSLPMASTYFIPTTLITGGYINPRFIAGATVWGISLLAICSKFWRKSLQSYEAVGA